MRHEPGGGNPVDEGVEKSSDLMSVAEDNSVAFFNILRLYARLGQSIADVTFGQGVFWKKVDQLNYHVLPTDIATGINFRNLPYEDECLDVVVLDPPYRYTPKKNKRFLGIDERYGLQASAPSRTQGVVKLYVEGMKEAARVLRVGGFLIVKCQDTIQDGANIWVHCDLIREGETLGYACRDLVVVTNAHPPQTRWDRQRHFRKAHSYFLVFRKGGHFPFGIPSMEKRDALCQHFRTRPLECEDHGAKCQEIVCCECGETLEEKKMKSRPRSRSKSSGDGGA